MGSKSRAYQQWTEQPGQYANSQELFEEVAYWTSIGESDHATLPTLGNVKEGAPRCAISATLTVEETKTLLENSHDAYNTQINDLLLAALAFAYQRW